MPGVTTTQNKDMTRADIEAELVANGRTLDEFGAWMEERYKTRSMRNAGQLAQPNTTQPYRALWHDYLAHIESEVAGVEDNPLTSLVDEVIMPGSRTFDPTRHLITLQHNARYLPVNKRLLWLRSEQPDALIHTELVQLGDGFALFKATVTLPSGATATGYGSETKSDFGDFIEKAESKSLGRALAALGYGTQFVNDEFDADGQHVADTPVGKGSYPTGNQLKGEVTEKQLKAIFTIGRDALGLSDADIDARCDELFHCAPENLSKADASRFIDMLKRDAA